MAAPLKTILDHHYRLFAQPHFIADDPIQIPARFSKKEDIEIAAFLAATIAWGQRKTIITNASRLMERMDNAPHDFIVHHAPRERKRLAGFVHRTFSEADAMFFMESLQNLYCRHGGLEAAFGLEKGMPVKERIIRFRSLFFELPHLGRNQKHVSDPSKGSSAKRLNMFLRWMVRPATEGVDFGIWTHISPSELMMPIDVHTGTVGRKLGLLSRKQDDWKAVEELTAALRGFDSRDPVKYDFALFGMGVSGAAKALS